MYRLFPRQSESYCVNVKNITVAVDEATYLSARVIAAKRNTSVSALVREFLLNLDSGVTDFERLRREEELVRQQVSDFSAGDRLSRENIHARKVQ